MIVGIAIDAWKFPIFERHLTEAGYVYTTTPLLEGTLLMKVDASSTYPLANVIQAANDEAAMTVRPS